MLPNRGTFQISSPLWAAMLISVSVMHSASANLEPDRQLEAGIHREIVLGDLPGALDLYAGLLANPAAPRPIAAQALLRTAECLEKLGRSEEAYSKYQKLVNEYSDQAADVKQARAKLAARSSPRNLKFEEGVPGRVPPGWRVLALPEDSGRMAELHRDGCRSHVGCAVVMAGANVPRAEGTLMQQFSAAAYRGKTVQLRAWLKLESLFAVGPSLRIPTQDDRAQLWLKVMRANRRAGFADNMDDRPVRSTEWTRCEITGEIDDDAEFINFGVISIGGGRVWLDDVSFDVLTKAEAGAARSPSR
jgi:hypothetical protein